MVKDDGDDEIDEDEEEDDEDNNDNEGDDDLTKGIDKSNGPVSISCNMLVIGDELIFKLW